MNFSSFDERLKYSFFPSDVATGKHEVVEQSPVNLISRKIKRA